MTVDKLIEMLQCHQRAGNGQYEVLVKCDGLERGIPYVAMSAVDSTVMIRAWDKEVMAEASLC